MRPYTKQQDFSHRNISTKHNPSTTSVTFSQWLGPCNLFKIFIWTKEMPWLADSRCRKLFQCVFLAEARCNVCIIKHKIKDAFSFRVIASLTYLITWKTQNSSVKIYFIRCQLSRKSLHQTWTRTLTRRKRNQLQLSLVGANTPKFSWKLTLELFLNILCFWPIYSGILFHN